MGRQPTPSHDAAHVLVSFQNGPSNKGKKRPLSLANATRPPETRRRVWRACESCRKKKIKCDGSDPCQCCVHTGSECIYAGDDDRRLWMGMGGNGCDESLAKRMQMLEDLVAKLVEDQRRLSDEIKCYKDGDGSGIAEMDSSQQDCSLELNEIGAAMPQEEIPPVVLDQPSGNTIDPELVESASQKNGMAVPGAESNDAGADAADCAYTDAYGQIYDQGDDAQ
ncbi:putative transcription factor [Aspergillus sp. HF37]|nr:putative transcription factor [Aspergillus sp. HF37]